MISKAGEGGYASCFVIQDIELQTPKILKLIKKPVHCEENVLKEFKL
jgi:hypothetical protein